MTVYDTLAEPLLLHGLVNKAGLDQAIRELMDNAGLARAFVRKYPHEFSGGQRQRIARCRALRRGLSLLWPTSQCGAGCDYSGADSRPARGSHQGIWADHAVYLARFGGNRQIAVMVMYHGKLVEEGSTAQVFETPQQDYTAHC